MDVAGLLLLLATAVSFLRQERTGALPRAGHRSRLGWGCGGWWLQSTQRQQRICGLISLVSGSVIALALLFSSPLWLWELNETSPSTRGSPESSGRASRCSCKAHDERPSLNWYARQRIRRHQKGDAGWILTRKPGETCMVSFSDGDWALAHCR